MVCGVSVCVCVCVCVCYHSLDGRLYSRGKNDTVLRTCCISCYMREILVVHKMERERGMQAIMDRSLSNTREARGNRDLQSDVRCEMG